MMLLAQVFFNASWWLRSHLQMGLLAWESVAEADLL